MTTKLFLGAAVLFGIALAILWSVKQRGFVAGIVVAISALGIGIPILWVLYYLSAYDTVHGFVGNITGAFGLPSQLTNAFAVLLVIPATIIAGMVMSLSSQRRTMGVVLLTAGIAIYWVLMWSGTRDHMVAADGGQLRCYTISSEGVQFFEQQKIDPRTGEMCEWVDHENLRYIQAIDRKLRSGQRIKPLKFASRDDVEFFATGTRGAIPLVWYFQDSDGTYEFYDVPGVHPVFGVPLKEITPKVADEWSSSFEFLSQPPIVDQASPIGDEIHEGAVQNYEEGTSCVDRKGWQCVILSPGSTHTVRTPAYTCYQDDFRGGLSIKGLTTASDGSKLWVWREFDVAYEAHRAENWSEENRAFYFKVFPIPSGGCS